MEPTSTKASIELSNQLEDGHVYAQTPAAPDGGPLIEPARPLRVLRDEDWICLRGPCRHYHRLEHAVDAEIPKDEVEVDGKVSFVPATHWGDGTPVSKPVATVHVCYPHPGVEMPMTDELVTSCSRWDPEDPDDPELVARELRRARFRLRVLGSSAESAPAVVPTPPKTCAVHGPWKGNRCGVCFPAATPKRKR